MRSRHFRRIQNQEGKGVIGCIFLIFLTGVAIYLGIVLVPLWYANFNLESSIKTEISKAGAHFYDDETITKDILDIARRNEIKLTRENVSIERFAGQVHIRVQYSVPVDFILFERDITFKTEGSTFVGAL